MKKKVIVDCDVGVDDALALILAFHSSELEVKAVTGVNGNVPLDLVFPNIKRVLSLIKPQDKPIIARGADRPLKGNLIHAYSVHGEGGLGRARLRLKGGQEWWRTSVSHASDLISKLARQLPGQLTLIALGPLTNLATALERDPEGMKRLKNVVIMGGAVRTRGNITPQAEFNIFADPHAAKTVLESGLPMTLVPLDVTHQVFLTPQVIEERVRPINNSFSKFLIEATDYDLATHRFPGGSERFHLHDPLAVAAVVNPDLVKKDGLFIHVDTEEGNSYGKTFEERRVASRTGRVEVCVEVNSAGFLDLFLARLGG